ncbi:MAG: chloride channel protein [Bacteroidales bacterium]|nr:chloride channel protein [Candidatus Colimorpha merdihippi]
MSYSEIYKKLHIWRLSHITEQTYLLMLSVIVGMLSGIAAVILKTIVHFVGQYVMAFGNRYCAPGGGNILIFVSPFVGILLTILFVRYIIKGSIGHGIPNVLLAISRQRGQLPSRNMYTSMLASTLTVAFGGSVGLEAPIASTGSAIGSNVGRFFRVSHRGVKLLLGCGAAGAIAGIFQAPLAGVLFTVEVLMFDMTMTTAVPLLIAALSASTVAYFLMGADVQFAFHVTQDFTLQQIPYLIVLGIFCALSSVYFLRCTDAVESWFAHRKNWISKCIAGGLALGLMIFLFPPLYGEGYWALTALLNGSNSDPLFAGSIFNTFRNNAWIALAILAVLILLKPIATASTIGSGGVGGTFGPSLVVGDLTGFFIASLCNQLGFPPLSTANFALVGMAGVMTGVMHAPFMGVFLIAEITGGYALMIPLLITAAVTYICVQPFEKHSIYARKLAAKGDLMTHNKDASAWHLMDLQKLIETNFETVQEDGTLRDIVEAIKRSKRNLFPVLDANGKFLGLIVMDDIRKIIFETELYDKVTVKELMMTFPDKDIVHSSEALSDVVQKFQLSNRYNLIVVDDDNNYLGFLSRANTFSAYRRFISQSSEE